MGRANSVQASWTKGEVSPLAAGRVDVSLYAAGAEVIENLIVRPQGPLFRRSGTKYVNSTKVPTNESVLVPFEVSDEQAYMLEFGKGYIRFFKNKEPIFETTSDEVEAFTLETDGGLMRLVTEDVSTSPTVAGTDYGDLPTFDISCVAPVAVTGIGCQITTTVPHGLRVGAKALIFGTGLSRLGGAIAAIDWTTEKITIAANHELVPGDTIGITGADPVYGINGLNTIATVVGNDITLTGINIGNGGATLGDWAKQVTPVSVTTRSFKILTTTNPGRSNTGFVASHGLVAGDKFYVSGAPTITSISERFLIAKSVATAHKWTVANVDYTAGTPTLEEAHTIPIEVESYYGYGRAVTIGSTATYFGEIGVTTTAPHGFTTGDTVLVYGAGNGVDGSWVVTVISTTLFSLDNSFWIGNTTGGTARKSLTASEFSIKDLKFAQSADVLYITHPLYPPSKLIRLDDDGDRNDWLFAEASFRDGPYMGLNDLSPNINSTMPQDGAIYPDVYMEVSSYAHAATLVSGIAFNTADDNLYIEWKEGDQWRLGRLGPSMAGGEFTTSVTVVDNLMIGIDETTVLKNKTTVGSTTSTGAVYRGYGAMGKSSQAGFYSRSGQYLGRIDPGNELASNRAVGANVIPAGTVTSQYNNTFAASDVGKYIRIKSSARTGAAYWVQITQVGTGTGGTETTSNKAQHSISVGMASNNETGKFVLSAHSRTCTLTSKKAGATFEAFSSTDIGRSIRLGFAGKWTWGKITGYTTTDTVAVTLYEDMPRDPNDASRIAGNQEGMRADGTLTTALTTSGITYDWRMGAWSYTTGFPACVVFHEQRLTFGATSTEPQTFWMSTSGDFENMSPTELDSTVLDDSAIAQELASAKANPIRWLMSGTSLGVGTAGGEWQIRSASSVNDPITPSSISAKEYTAHGAGSRLMPAKAGTSVLFVDRSKRKVHELLYSYESDSVVSDELTVIGEHILREHGGAVWTAYQQKPHSIYWVGCGDGTLAALTFNKRQEVVAWHHHTIKGALVDWGTTIPSNDGTEDELWMVCKRSVSSGDTDADRTYRTIEILESDFYPSSTSSKLGMTFQDSHIVLDPSVATFTGSSATVTGLNWLAYRSVTVMTVDTAGTTATLYSKTVSSDGAITAIPVNGMKEVIIGSNADAYVTSLPPEGGSNFGTSQGQKKRLVYLDTRFLNTMNVTFGPNSTDTVTKTLPVTSPTVWFSGTERLVPKSGYDVESKYYIGQTDPYPLNVLFVVAKLETNE